MPPGEIIVEVGPARGVVRGALGSKVFTAARALPDKKRWQNGVLLFEATTANLDLLRAALPEASWTAVPLDPLPHYGKTVAVAKFPAGALLPPRLPAPGPEDVDGGHTFRREPVGRQREAFNFARDLDTVALFMWMGTGKSFVNLNLAAHWWRLNRVDRWLITAPNGVHRQWLEEQLTLHMPPWARWEGQLHRGGSTKLKPWSKDDDTLKVLALNVEALSHESGAHAASNFMSGGRTLFTGDESSRFKTHSALRTKTAIKLGALAAKGAILSGMPVTKSLQDLYAQYKVLDPRIIGLSSYYAFRNRYCVMGGFEQKQVIGYRNVEELLAKIAPYTFIAAKEPGVTVLPPIIREYELNAEQRRIYREIKNDLLTFVAEANDEVGEARALAMAHAADALVKLQQVTNGFIEDKKTGFFKVLSTTRAELCADVVEEAGEQQVLVYCRFHRDMDMVLEVLNRRDVARRKAGETPFNAVEYSGRVDRDQRAANKKLFTGGAARVLVGTAAAGGVGVDGLQVASVTAYYSNTFSLEDREQSKARTDRTGQLLPVTYVDFIGSPVDKLNLRNLEAKKTISDMVLSVGDGDI